MLHALSKLWWVLALRGLCAIVIGTGAFVAPAATLAVLILVFGAYALVDGALLLVTALGNHRAAPDRWPLPSRSAWKPTSTLRSRSALYGMLPAL
ncbi:DUF308 domain-containing protein, partial [Ralstonia pseudosolanacearum]|uniref:DUF308 domain-containing protein n=1 Tax=Ralstonia pseudosolanacearum TaxID=1310165 RepID=UPI003CE6E3F4